MYKLFNEKTVFGFKAFEKSNQGLKCRDYIYTPGKLHEIDGLPVLCSRGFHFCENLEDIGSFYDLSSDNVIVYPVAAVGDVTGGRDKKATNKIIVFDNPVPDDVKKSRFRFFSKDVIELSDGTEFSASLDNEVDRYLFEHLKDTEKIKKGYINMTLGDYMKSKDTIGSLNYADNKRLVAYCKETDQEILSFKMIEDFLDNKLIISLFDGQVFSEIEKEFPKAAHLVMHNNRIKNVLGFFKSSDGYYYIPELDKRNR